MIFSSGSIFIFSTFDCSLSVEFYNAAEFRFRFIDQGQILQSGAENNMVFSFLQLKTISNNVNLRKKSWNDFF